MAVGSGMAAINYAILTIARAGDNIVSTPQLYGGTYTLFAHMLPSQGIEVRFAEDDSPEAIEKLIDDKTKAVYCETIGNPAGILLILNLFVCGSQTRCGCRCGQHCATPALCNPIEFMPMLSSIHSPNISEDMALLSGRDRGLRQISLAEHAARYPELNEPEPSYHGWCTQKRWGSSIYRQGTHGAFA